MTIKKIAAQGSINAFALDTDGHVWFWGYQIGLDYENKHSSSADTGFISNFTDTYSLNKLDWFEKNGIRVLDFAVGQCYTIFKVEDRSNEKHIYALMSPAHHS